MRPYYQDDLVTLYYGDCRTIVPDLAIDADLIVADPPYAETNLAAVCRSCHSRLTAEFDGSFGRPKVRRPWL